MAGKDTCGAVLKQIHDVLEKQANNTLRGQGLTFSQSAVLMLLYEREEKAATFKELEKDFGVAQPTMAGILSRLEQKRLIAVLEDAEDKRIRRAQLTQAGAEKCREGEWHMKAAEERLLCGLTEEEKAELLRLLIKVQASMTEKN